MGTENTLAELQQLTGTQGEVHYVNNDPVTDNNGLYYYDIDGGIVPSDGQWVKLGLIMGPTGPAGPTGPSGSSFILPYSSSGLFTLTTSVSGTPYRCILIGQENFDVIDNFTIPLNISGKLNLTFPLPVNVNITGISLHFHLVTNTIISSPTAFTKLTAQLFIGDYADGNNFTPINGTEISLDIPFSAGVNSFYQNILSGINIPVTATSRLLLAVFSDTTPGYSLSTTISGRLSAGLHLA